MYHPAFVFGAISFGLFLVATLLAGRFSSGPTFTRRYRHTALLGIRVRSGSGFQGQPTASPIRHFSQDHPPRHTRLWNDHS